MAQREISRKIHNDFIIYGEHYAKETQPFLSTMYTSDEERFTLLHVQRLPRKGVKIKSIMRTMHRLGRSDRWFSIFYRIHPTQLACSV